MSVNNGIGVYKTESFCGNPSCIGKYPGRKCPKCKSENYIVYIPSGSGSLLKCAECNYAWTDLPKI